jgi:Rod binding domain-containing protein
LPGDSQRRPSGIASFVVAISPPSDIVLGVALAADPEQYRLAAERLRRISGTREAARSETLPWTTDSAPVRTAATAGTAVLTPAGAPTAKIVKGAKGAADAFGQLEAFVLQSFIQSMLPKNAEHVFGKGAAGEVWKSMLAEKLANELSRSGQVGLAKRLAAGQAGVPSAAPAPASASLASVLPYLQSKPVAAPQPTDAATAVPASDAKRS